MLFWKEKLLLIFCLIFFYYTFATKCNAELAQLVEQLIRPNMNNKVGW